MTKEEVKLSGRDLLDEVATQIEGEMLEWVFENASFDISKDGIHVTWADGADQRFTIPWSRMGISWDNPKKTIGLALNRWFEAAEEDPCAATRYRDNRIKRKRP